MEMPPKEFQKYASWCNRHQIRLYPEAASTSPVPGLITAFKIVKEVDGKPLKGTKVYRDKPAKGEMSVWDKIANMYKEIYEKNNKSEKQP